MDKKPKQRENTGFGAESHVRTEAPHERAYVAHWKRKMFMC